MFSADLGVQAAGAPPFAGTQFLAVGYAGPSFVNVYPWNISTGFGTKFSDPSPALLNGGAGPQDVAFSPSGNAIAIATGGQSDPKSGLAFGVQVYGWSLTGFGTKFAQPSSIPSNFNGEVYGVAFSPSGNSLAVAMSTPNGLFAYPWSGSGFGSSVQPAVVPVNANSVAFSPSGNAIAVALQGSPYIRAYSWTDTAFGGQFPLPTTLPPSAVYDCTFSPSGNALAVAHDATPFISVYPWTVTGFGTKVADPTTLPNGTSFGCAFSPDGTALAVAQQGIPFISAYPWTGSGFGTKFADPTTPVGAGTAGRDCSFSLDGTAVVLAHQSGTFITAYRWTSAGFGAKFSNPSTLPTNNSLSCAFGVIP